jgi:serine/threonine protein kinase
MMEVLLIVPPKYYFVIPTTKLWTFLGKPKKNPHFFSSLGTCLYYMLSGKFPFCDPKKTTHDELLANIHKGNLEFYDHDLVSLEAQDLIRRMLAPAPKRISIVEIRSHPWLDGCYSD